MVSGGGAWYVISHGKAEWLAAILWPIFLFWQLFPVVATAFTENFDTSNLLRFPLSYSSFVLIRIAYGSLEPATMLGSLWLLGVAAGIGIASPHLFFWSALVLLLFATMNILLARMIFSWVERWLAQRRIREILGVLFLLFIISFQLIGPLISRYGNREHPQILQLAQWVLPLQRFLPPGSAGSSIAGAADADFTVAAEGFGILGAYCLAIFWLLNIRMRAQFRGENLSEAPAPAELSGERGTTRVGWSLPGVSGSVAAIFEKEIHYLSRSGPMLFTLIMPVFMLFIFRLTPSTYARGSGSLLGRSSDMAFPMGAAYALLILTNLVYNNFGAEGAGVQLYFIAPVPIRSVMLAKNLAHSSILALEMIFVWIGASLMYGPPALVTTVATAAGILFALPVNLIVGNLLSISFTEENRLRHFRPSARFKYHRIRQLRYSNRCRRTRCNHAHHRAQLRQDLAGNDCIPGVSHGRLGSVSSGAQRHRPNRIRPSRRNDRRAHSRFLGLIFEKILASLGIEMRRRRSAIICGLPGILFLAIALPASAQSGGAEHQQAFGFATLKSLDDVPAISGYEKQLGDQLSSQLLAFHPQVDNIGDVVVTLGSGTPHRLLVTGIDEPGFVVSAITDDGYLRVQRLPQNGLPPMFDELYSAQPVKIGTTTGAWIDGVVAGLSVHLTSNRAATRASSDLDEMYIDIGASSADEVRKAGVDVLSPIAINRRLFNLAEAEFAGAAVGDRFGAAALLELLALIDPAKLKGTLTIAFVVQQRIGARGLQRILTTMQFDEMIYVGRLFAGGPLTGAENLRRAPRKDPGSGILFAGEETNSSPGGLAAELKKLASAEQIPFAADYSASVIPLSYLPPPETPPKSVHVGIATAWADTPAETINAADFDNLVKLLVAYTQAPGRSSFNVSNRIPTSGHRTTRVKSTVNVHLLSSKFYNISRKPTG